MKSWLDGLPPEVAQRIHPDWQRNETEYWAARDTLLPQYRDQWIGFTNGRVIVSGASAVEVLHAAQASDLHPFVTCVGREHEPSRMRRLVIVNAPDLWIINLATKTGQHLVDRDKPSHFHASIHWSPGKPDFLQAFEFGCELGYMQERSATPPEVVTSGESPVQKYEAAQGAYRIVLMVPPTSQKPFAVEVYKDGILVDSTRYLEYEHVVSPDMQLFERPEGIRYQEVQ